MISSKLIKSNDELMTEIGENGIMKDNFVSTESRIIKIDIDFVEKSKIEVGRIFENCKSQIQQKLYKIKLQFLI